MKPEIGSERRQQQQKLSLQLGLDQRLSVSYECHFQLMLLLWAAVGQLPPAAANEPHY